MLIFLVHNMVDLAQMSKGIGLGVWATIETFQAFGHRLAETDSPESIRLPSLLASGAARFGSVRTRTYDSHDGVD